MALIIAITYSLTDDKNIDGSGVENVTQPLTNDTDNDNRFNNRDRSLNGTEIFTILLQTDWPLSGNFNENLILLNDYGLFYQNARRTSNKMATT